MFDIFIWDMGGHDFNVQNLLERFPHAKSMRYLGSHLEMLRRTATRSRTEYFWVISSCCNYDSFDFNWIPPVGQERQLHCWASGTEKFGDTFLVNLSEWNKQQGVEKLEWYHDVNYHGAVPQLEWPVVDVNDDDLARAIKETDFNSLYVMFRMQGTTSIVDHSTNKWADRAITAFNKNGHVVLVPRDSKQTIKSQVFDHPRIEFKKAERLICQPQDIIFISYDEKNADENWEKLLAIFPRAIRIHGVKGLVSALKAAASAATTPYFYAVFGKTEVRPDFNFDHQPDYLRHPANYIFLAYNPILDHAYGHGGIVMHNRKFLLETEEFGTDITMSTHTVTIPVISCDNRLDSDPWSAWRTAFRETYKLSALLDQRPSIEDEYHLHLWLTRENTAMGKWSRLGANEGRKAYLDGTKADVNDWNWLQEKFQGAQRIIADSIS